MLNIPIEIQNVIKNDATLKNFRVHFPNGERADLTNENIVFESVRFTESVCSSNTFRFGLAEASVIEFEMVGIENIAGKTIECSMEFKVPQNLVATYGQWYSIPYGKFIVDKCPRDHRNMTHRKVTGYSMLKYLSNKPNFLQNRILNIPSVHVSYNVLYAYAVNDVSDFSETEVIMRSASSANVSYLYDEDGKPYSFSAWSGDVNVGGIKTSLIRTSDNYDGFKLDYEETGTVSNKDVGDAVVDYLDNTLNVQLLYDANGKKVFKTNKEALEYWYGYFFHPVCFCYTVSGSYGIFYPSYDVPNGEFYPIIKEDALNSNEMRYCVTVLNDVETIQIRKYNSADVIGAVGSLLGTVNINGYSETETLNAYQENAASFGKIEIGATLSVSPTLMYRRQVSNKLKDYYGTGYAYSNAYSNRDILAGFAELNGSFLHSERDGTLSSEPLDNSTPYQLSLSDVENSVWWDEYVVNPIGTIKYTFLNPNTGNIESDSYVFNENAKSTYDMSGNEILESIDFSIKKASTASKMTDKSKWYKYTGTEAGYVKDNFYYYNGTSWVSGGHYENASSIVHFVLDSLFVPHVNAVNFTPVEMNLRGLPFLEAGDAFTLTAEDGTVLNSYILNHEFDGIQHLTESVESVSGEVIE